MKRIGISLFVLFMACGSGPLEIGSLDDGDRLPSPSGMPTAGLAGAPTGGRSTAAIEADAGSGARPVLPRCECPAIENAVAACVERNSGPSCEYVCDVGHTFSPDYRCVPVSAANWSDAGGGRNCVSSADCQPSGNGSISCSSSTICL